MKKYSLLIVMLLFAAVATMSCKKKTRGICYCEFYSGAESQYDYRHLPRDQQNDSCEVNNQNAANFVGNCKLK
jgi:hypothetical protein